MKWLCVLGVLAVVGCANQEPVVKELVWLAGDPKAPSQVTPSEALSTAHRYAHHAWQPFAHHIRHGVDGKGVLVHTPDVGFQPDSPRKGWWIPGTMNQGVPYKWGGFDSVESFDAAIANGAAAGDVSSPAKRVADNLAVSDEAAGVDCSGFVSRCLNLPKVHDTRQLPALCDPVLVATEMRAGDILNIEQRHVMLVAGWADPEKTWVYYYDTGGGPEYWRPSLKKSPLESLLKLGYRPLRYRGMARLAGNQEVNLLIRDVNEVLTRAAKSTAVSVPNPTVGMP